ncbi:MAG: ABC transporter permease [Betaproteobacteria bacterium]|nr:ABC transporter permease [Betaproteobacteria bacterium]
MRRFFWRLVSLLVIVAAVTVLTFAITEILPGDTAVAILGESATPDLIAALREELGLDRPLTVRYVEWLSKALSGDLGHSYRSNEAVSRMVLDRLPVTLELIVLSQILALVVAVPLGILAAYRVGSRLDRLITALSVGFLSTPPFLLGILLIYGISVHAGLLPAAGFKSLQDGWGANLRSMLLPSLTLALAECPVYLRLLRADMITTLQQDFVLVARAKGLEPHEILLRHALKLSSFSLVTVIGVNMGRLVGGSVIVETMFSLPGIGQMIATAAFQHDHFAIQGVILLVAVGFVLVNLLVDAIYTVLDPRVRHALRS